MRFRRQCSRAIFTDASSLLGWRNDVAQSAKQVAPGLAKALVRALLGNCRLVVRGPGADGIPSTVCIHWERRRSRQDSRGLQVYRHGRQRARKKYLAWAMYVFGLLSSPFRAGRAAGRYHPSAASGVFRWQSAETAELALARLQEAASGGDALAAVRRAKLAERSRGFFSL